MWQPANRCSGVSFFSRSTSGAQKDKTSQLSHAPLAWLCCYCVDWVTELKSREGGNRMNRSPKVEQSKESRQSIILYPTANQQGCATASFEFDEAAQGREARQLHAMPRPNAVRNPEDQARSEDGHCPSREVAISNRSGAATKLRLARIARVATIRSAGALIYLIAMAGTGLLTVMLSSALAIQTIALAQPYFLDDCPCRPSLVEQRRIAAQAVGSRQAERTTPRVTALVAPSISYDALAVQMDFAEKEDSPPPQRSTLSTRISY